MPDNWTSCEGRIVNGIFPLRRLLGSSDHSGVFLSEWPARNLTDVAIKLVPALPALARVQLAHWSAAAALSNPHLLPLFETGRWQLDERHFLFAVMEYADENLAQVLPQRALTSEEVQHMLRPITEALAYLHGRGLVHGRLKPSNILVVKDEIKLSSDGVRPFGESTFVADTVSAYDPPEARTGRVSPAGDVWSLGMTLVEALTRELPKVPEDHLEPVALPAGIPPELVEILRKCLNRDPDNRPSIDSFTGPPTRAMPPPTPAPSPPLAPAVTPKPIPPPPASMPAPVSPADEMRRSLWLPALIALAVIAVGVWAARRMFHGDSGSAQVTTQTAPKPAPAAPATLPPVSSPREKSAPSTPTTADPVVQRSIPQVSRASRDTIHGRIKVSVRVTVDPAGNVVNETVELAGPSHYFARVAADAARKWKFVPAPDEPTRQWLLWFEFTRDGTNGHLQ